MKKSDKIQLASIDQCTGCSACASICPTKSITMIEDKEGFLQPHIDTDSCIQCHKCEKTCPIISPIAIPTDFETQAYAAINKDEAVRMRSSSGGMFHALAKWTIEKGGVVFGAAFEGIHLNHQYAETLDEAQRFMGSKYIQSDVANSYRDVKNFLEGGSWVLYSGTPCQIAGLKKYLGREYDKLLTVDLICYGVPSPAIWEKYIKRKLKQLKAKDIYNISFRHNTDYRLSFDFINYKHIRGQFDEDSIRNDYYAFFTRRIFRVSCYLCQFRSIGASHSDFTIGDCWNAPKDHENMVDGKGISTIVIQTNSAYNTFEQIKNGFELDKEDLSILQHRYEHMLHRGLLERKIIPWRISNILAQYVPLEYLRFVYMHDRINIIVKRRFKKIVDKYRYVYDR